MNSIQSNGIWNRMFSQIGLIYINLSNRNDLVIIF